MTCAEKARQADRQRARWRREKRTVADLVRREASRVGSIKQVEREAGISPETLRWTIRRTPKPRAYGVENALLLAARLRVPLVAALNMHIPVKDALRLEDEALCGKER